MMLASRGNAALLRDQCYRQGGVAELAGSGSGVGGENSGLQRRKTGYEARKVARISVGLRRVQHGGCAVANSRLGGADSEGQGCRSGERQYWFVPDPAEAVRTGWNFHHPWSR